MGLIRAGLNAAGGVLADQWKEFFTCDAIGEGVLALKGRKSGGRRSVNRGSDNVITTGSGPIKNGDQVRMADSSEG